MKTGKNNYLATLFLAGPVMAMLVSANSAVYA